MSIPTTSRRQFVQLTGSLALALRHGLLPAEAGETTGAPVATLGDPPLRIEWDANLYARVSRVDGQRLTAMTAWGPSDYLLRLDGRHISQFALRAQARKTVADAHGHRSRLTLVGMSAEGIEKTVKITLYQRYPGFAIIRLSYRNTSAETIPLQGWTNSDFLVRESASGTPGILVLFRRVVFGSPRLDSTHQTRVRPGQLSWNGSARLRKRHTDCRRVASGWRAGHRTRGDCAETRLPARSRAKRATRIALCSRAKHGLRASEVFETLDSFVAVHDGDYFATLNTYRRIMAERGIKPAEPVPACYESIWCAWGYERDCTTALIEGTLPKVKDLGLDWAVIDDGWQAKIGDWRPDPAKYPNGEEDLRGLVAHIRGAGLKPRLWYSPLSVAPGSDLLHDHTDMLLLDKDGAVQNISWWNSFYLCPAYDKTLSYTEGLIKTFLGKWGFEGLKIDGQHLNGVAPCFNPAASPCPPGRIGGGAAEFLSRDFPDGAADQPECRDRIVPVWHGLFGVQFPLHESGARLRPGVFMAGAPQRQNAQSADGAERSVRG